MTKRVLDTTSDTLVRLQIWDTAGQERFRSISRLYYRGASACLLCYDITDENSFREMTGWLKELQNNVGEDRPMVIHVVGTKSDIVALDPSRRKVPFERTIAYVAEQLYPSQASTPPPSAGFGSTVSGSSGSASGGAGMHFQGPDSKRSSVFWGQDIGWDCCHEISAKDGEGVEEVFRVIARKLVEQRNKQLTGDSSSQATQQRGDASSEPEGMDGRSSFRVGLDKRRSWLGFPPSLVASEEIEAPLRPGKQRRPCC